MSLPPDLLKELVARQMARMEQIGVRLEELGGIVDRARDEATIEAANTECDKLLDEIRDMDNEIRQVELGLARRASAA